MAVTAVTSTAWKITGVGDFNGDGVADIFWRNGSTGQNTIWRSANYATQQPVAAAASAWRVANIGDFDGDGVADVMWRNASTGQNGIWKRANSATPQGVATVAARRGPSFPTRTSPDGFPRLGGEVRNR